jgi:hypothetical protein
LITLQQVMRRGFAAYARERRLPLHVHQAARAIVECRTPAMGGHVWSCPQGHETRVHYNSCRHRACPQCGRSRVDAWLEARLAQLLACEHYHVIFTVPHELEPLWFAQRARMQDLLFGAVRDTLLALLADEGHLGAQPGVVATLHTWGRTLSFHPHVHCLVTGGGWSGAGWKAVRNGYLLPVRVVRALFRGKLLAALRSELARGRLVLPPGFSRVRLESLLRLLGRRTWNVHLRERYAHGRGVLVYLGRYLRGGPISNRRLVGLTDDSVVFRYRDHRDGRTKRLALPLAHFLQRLTWHVPEPRLHLVRYWGLYARDQASAREAARHALGSPASPAPRTAAPSPHAPGPARAETPCTTCGRLLIPIAIWRRGREPPCGVLR